MAVTDKAKREGKGRRGLLGFIALCLVGAVLGAFVFFLRRDSGAIVAASDAMLIPGVLFLAVSGLIWVRELGGFDAIGYALRTAAFSFIPGARARGQSFSEYKKRRRSGAAMAARLLTVGLLFFLPAVVLSIAAL